jgi:hypothetical protein
VWDNGDCGPQTPPACGFGLPNAGVNDINYFKALLAKRRAVRH